MNNDTKPLPEDETGKVFTLGQTSFVVAESVYVSGARSIKYIIEYSGVTAASIHKGMASKNTWDPCEVMMNLQYVTLNAAIIYRALLDVVIAKMQQLDNDFPPGSKVK